MHERKHTMTNTKTPDLSKMKAVVIDGRTVIYIEQGASEEDARKRYLTRGDYLTKSYLKPKVVAASK